MANQKRLLSFLILLTLRMAMAKDVISVGVILDLNNYNTRLALLTRDSGDDVVSAASAGIFVR